MEASPVIISTSLSPQGSNKRITYSDVINLLLRLIPLIEMEIPPDPKAYDENITKSTMYNKNHHRHNQCQIFSEPFAKL